MSPKNAALLVLSLWLVIGSIVVGGCAGGETGTPAQLTPTPTQIIGKVSPQGAFTLIQDSHNNPGLVILDVRTPGEFAGGHIEEAINMDYYSEDFRDRLDDLDKDKVYLIYCRSGNRSGQALSIMEELNFREVYDMRGGIVEWKEEKLPTVK